MRIAMGYYPFGRRYLDRPFSVDFLWDYIWLLCIDIKDRRRRFWWSFNSPPRRALCFYHSISAIVDSSVQLGPLLTGLIHQSGCFCLSIFKQCSYSVNHIYKAPLLMPREQTMRKFLAIIVCYLLFDRAPSFDVANF